MTSNEVKALGRSQRRNAHRGLRLLIAALSLSLAMLVLVAAPVLAVETSTTTTSSTETGYSQKPKVPAEKKVAPAKEEKAAPKKEVAPAKEPTPVVTSAPAKATELPFTGLDLRWVVGGGLLLIAVGGVSLGVMRRHERQGIGR
jgi:uncharacterized membrane protein